MLTALIIAIGIILLALLYGSGSVRHSFYVRSFCRQRTREREVALTFDDGPDPKQTPLVLDILKEERVPATFFVIGNRVERSPELIRRMIAEGHAVGNHSYTHKGSFPLLSARAMAWELERTDHLLKQIAGTAPRLFRPPFGVTNPTLRRAIKQRGCQSVGWDVRSLDTLGRSRRKTVRRILKRVRPGSVILLHDDREGSEHLLRELIQALKQRNYTFRRIDEWLA